MRLSDKAIQDFKQVYFKDQSIRLSDDEANRFGVELLEFFKLLYKPIPQKDYEHFKKA